MSTEVMAHSTNHNEIKTFQGCYYSSEHMDGLTESIGEVAAELKALNASHAQVMRWLLITVCVLALGKALPEIKDVFWPTIKAEASK